MMRSALLAIYMLGAVSTMQATSLSRECMGQVETPPYVLLVVGALWPVAPFLYAVNWVFDAGMICPSAGE